MALCVSQTTSQAPMGLPVPRAVSGMSSSRGHENVDDLLARLAQAAEPLRISIPPVEDEMDKLTKLVETREALRCAETEHMALCFNSSASEWRVQDAQLKVAELRLELAQMTGDKTTALKKRVARLRAQMKVLDEEVVEWQRKVLVDLSAPLPKKKWWPF